MSHLCEKKKHIHYFLVVLGFELTLARLPLEPHLMNVKCMHFDGGKNLLKAVQEAIYNGHL
jgi:hypothetical protein